MSSVNLKIVRSDGAVFGDWSEQTPESNGWNIGCGKGWSIPNDGIDGAAELVYQVTTSDNVLSDGSALVSKRVAETERTIKLVCTSQNADVERRNAIAFFNPKFSFELHIDYRGVQRHCVGEQTAFKADSGNIYGSPSITWTLLCLDPYMLSEDHNESSLTDAAPMFGFPYVSHVRQVMPDGSKKPVGFLASKMLYDGLNTIYNSGDVETYCRIVCEFDGPVTNPKFTKDGRFVQVLTTFKDGDELEIDFETAPPRVLVNGTNAIQLCSRDSNFTGMQMQVGPNVFQYEGSTAAERAYMHVQVLFYKRYLGV